MKIATIDKLVWILVYAGLVVGAFGLSLQASLAEIGWSVVALGAALIIAGAVLIALRARTKGE